jgi:hypothetical protein
VIASWNAVKLTKPMVMGFLRFFVVAIKPTVIVAWNAVKLSKAYSPLVFFCRSKPHDDSVMETVKLTQPKVIGL